MNTELVRAIISAMKDYVRYEEAFGVEEARKCGTMEVTDENDNVVFSIKNGEIYCEDDKALEAAVSILAFEKALSNLFSK